MNERIRLLAEQAFFDESTSRPSTKMYTFSDHKMEKFAQLIVQECADKCLEMAYANPGPHHYAAMLKEHFGVEEHHAD
jgi:hypothetical protein